MTVAELIEQLKLYSPGQRVVVAGQESVVYHTPWLSTRLLIEAKHQTMLKYDGGHESFECLVIDCI